MANTVNVLKYQIEKFYIGVDFSLNLAKDEVISEAEVSCTPSGLNLDGDPIIQGTIVSQLISGGDPGQLYYISFIATTSQGCIFKKVITVAINKEPWLT